MRLTRQNFGWFLRFVGSGPWISLFLLHSAMAPAFLLVRHVCDLLHPRLLSQLSTSANCYDSLIVSVVSMRLL
jgi:hypothetical protein